MLSNILDFLEKVLAVLSILDGFSAVSEILACFKSNLDCLAAVQTLSTGFISFRNDRKIVNFQLQKL